jgi:lipopolysaccharide/colanic/teichoic acid biosynthesis glycosyltransferase
MVLKRLLDFTAAFFGLLVLSPVLLPTMFLIYIQDFRSPIYSAPRMRDTERTFKMYKLRSMVANADKIGGTSTADSDKRITWVGKMIRKWKLDELSQLWNVLIGDMSLVGPRPQARRDASLYTEEENRLLTVKPGITDFSSIIFSDLGDILAGSKDPDLEYNQIVRPWKSRLGLFYIDNRSMFVDISLILITFISILSKESALRIVQKLLESIGADARLVEIARRKVELHPYPPPGSDVVETRY